MKNLKKIIYLLSPQEIKQAILLLIMFVIMALVEMIGIASIIPFIAVLSNPDVIDTNVYLILILKMIFFLLWVYLFLFYLFFHFA